jgi:hypothetical protein
MITLELGVLEDVLPPTLVSDLELTRADAPEALVAWWRTALGRLNGDSRLTAPWRNPELVAAGLGNATARIEVLLCSRDSLDALADVDGTALGVHLVSTPDTDPFDEASAFARVYRVLVVSDVEEFLCLTGDLAEGDVNPGAYADEYLCAYLNTAFHEIAHAILFAENANLLPPSEIDTLSDAGEFHNDVFDCSTGYGVRPLEIDGDEIWAEDVDHATDLMEIYVEALGRNMMNQVLTGDIAPWTFPEALGCADRFEVLFEPSA